MKVTFAYFPRGSPSVQLSITYEPKLDAQNLPSGGFLNIETNEAIVNWETFKIFRDAELADRITAFKVLSRINEPFKLN